MSITGFNADHRLRLPSSAVVQVAAALASEILKSGGISGLDSLARLPGIDPKWVTSCAKDLLNHAGKSLVVAGYRQQDPAKARELIKQRMAEAQGGEGKMMLMEGSTVSTVCSHAPNPPPMQTLDACKRANFH